MTEGTGRNAMDGFQLRWTLARKIGGLAAMIVVLMLIIAAYNYRALDVIGGEITEIASADLPVTRLVANLETYQLEQHVALERVVSTVGSRRPDAATRRDAAAAEFESQARQFDVDYAKLAPAVDGAVRLSPEYQRFGDEVRLLQKEHGDFSTIGRQIIAAIAADRQADADRLIDQIDKEANDVDVQATKMLTEIERFTEESATNAQTTETGAKTVSGVLSLVGTAAAIILSFVFVGGLRRSVSGVTGIAGHIADGNLRQEKLVVRTSDEMGQLGLIFNDMLESLRDNVTQTRSAAESLNAAVAEIVASVKEQAAGTSEQAAAVQETTATMEEINQSGNQISERSRQVAAAAEATTTATSQGLDAAQNGTRIMEAIQEQAETVAENIVTLSEKTQAVGEIIATVTDIAEQSNLLALNAAIEAAAAGEQGRSFAVVANEIKNLADQAKEATGKVRSILGDIQKGINTSVMLTEEVVKRVDTGKKQTDVVEKTIRHMADSLNTSIQAFQQITAATGQQQIGFDQVTQALKNIRQAADQTAVSTSQLEKAATNMSVLGQQLNRNVEKYRT